ncbi:MAG: NADPH-dependent oxidoreductase [Candidatus Polarisedimenticolia bacterium]|nr:NADPH-dependent oxidoreductase [bacterium]
MNEAISVLLAHKSERSYTDEAVSDADLATIVEAGRRGPTSINGQQVSVVVVRDAERRAKIAEIAGGQPWIAKAPVFLAVLIDFHKTAVALRMAGREQVIHESVEGTIVGSIDAGIALGAMMTAARALGLGTVPIGGIRRDPDAMVALLGLPPMTFPVVGMCVGHVAEPAERKPRLPLPAFRFDERYDEAALEPAIAEYDVELAEHWKKIGRADGLPWSANLAGIYDKVYFPHVKGCAAKQGFKNDK